LPQFKPAIVVSANSTASRAGLRILKRGGNAVDAAVATAQTLGVAAPAFSGIGGGGFALIWIAKEERPVFIDYRERAPSSASEDMFQLGRSGEVIRDENSIGYKAVAVPGTLTGHALMLEKYGTVSLKAAMEPAINCAKKGVEIGRALAYAWKQSAGKLRRFKTSRSTYLLKGRPYRKVEEIKLTDLATTLATIATNGHREFYDGATAGQICDDMASNGGLVTRSDLERYAPTFRDPVRGTYKDFEVISAPPPSAGGPILLQSLNVLEAYQLKSYGFNSTQSLHLLSEALARGNMNCRTRICDPDSTNVPIKTLVSKDFAQQVGASINTTAASFPSKPVDFPSMPESNTTHMVVADSEGNIVSMTESVECYFGSGITVPGTGVILNDTMHDFEPRPHMANSVGPWKVPMSSMSPTIVLSEGRPIMALGSAGGPRIVSSTLQVLLNVIEFGMRVKDAVAAPRIHVQGERIQLESSIPRATLIGLRKMGHRAEVRRRRGKNDPGLYFGGVHAAYFTEDAMSGGADPRRDGLAVSLR
jgi:gamma-glutamyltranspeptidase/glutathione hydrolase